MIFATHEARERHIENMRKEREAAELREQEKIAAYYQKHAKRSQSIKSSLTVTPFPDDYLAIRRICAITGSPTSAYLRYLIHDYLTEKHQTLAELNAAIDAADAARPAD